MKNILIITQARVKSTRLPGKVLRTILNKPLLFYLVERLNLVQTPNKFIIATGPAELNKEIIDFAKKFNLNYFIGSENDVLDRYYQTSKKFNGDIIVRITSDCPLMDPNLIDNGLKMFFTMKYEYVSNAHPPTYPDGYDIEIFSFKKLENAWKKAILPSEREHVTPYIWKNIDKSKMGNFEHDVDLSKFRLTVDTQEDFLLISKIFENFHDNWRDFRLKDVINFLTKNPELLKINAQYERNEGYLKSLREDKTIKN